MQIDNFNKLIMQERAARETQMESWRAYMSGEKEARDDKEQSMVTRDELDAVTKSMWAEIRNHTHDVTCISGTVAAEKSPSRSPSPMPPTRTVISPGRVTVADTMVSPKE